MICTCARHCRADLLQLWQRRSAHVVRRLVARGYGVNTARMSETVNRILLLESEHPSCFQRTGHSHHLPDCPWKRNEPPVQTAYAAGSAAAPA